MNEVTVIDVLHADRTTQIIDVRERDELATGMIDGAMSLPMSEIGSRLAEIDPARPVIAVCRSGGRSTSVASALSKAGFTCATMAGGMVQWAAEGLPVTCPR